VIEQLALSLNEPIIPVVDISHVTPEEMPRLSRQSQLILNRLRCGPARNTELVEIAVRYGARLLDLRRSGFRITTELDRASGVAVYRLVGGPCA
jgi:hypothetical protein